MPCDKDITIANSRQTAWIVNVSKLAKQICKSCLRCRFLKKLLEDQKMSSLPQELQVPAPPLVGPIVVKAMVNKKMKVWVVIFLCLIVKAVCMELALGYPIKDFLIAYHSFISLRGNPSFVHSDRGSQLVTAQKNISEDLPKFDLDIITTSTSNQGTTWKFAPAGAQWHNGDTEAFVKIQTVILTHVKNTEFNYSELNCAIK